MTFPHRRSAVAPLLVCLILAVAMAGATPALGGPEGKKDHPRGHEKDKARPEQTPAPERSQDPPESAPEERGHPGGEGSEGGSAGRGNDDHPQGRERSDSRGGPHGDETTAPPASPTPGGSPKPAPSGPKDPSDDASLRLNASSGVLLGQVGQVVPYTIHVEVDEAVPRLVVTASVAPEVDIASVPLNERVDTISSARRGPREDIVWVLEEVPAQSQFDLYWYGRLAAAGDLEATTTVEARAQESTAGAEARTFIATADVATSGATEPDKVLGKVVRLVPVVREVPVSIAPAGAVLPVTGWSPAGMLWIAFGCIALGSSLLVLSRTSPRVRHGAALGVLIVLTACTLSTDGPADPAAAPPSEEAGAEDTDDSQRPGGEDDEQESRKPRDRVKGKVIYRDQAPDTQAPAPATEPAPPATTTEITYRRVVEEVPGQPAAQQPDRDGDNMVSFAWDEPARSVANAASSTRLTAEQPSRLVASLAWDRTGLISTVTLENTSSEPLHVRGTIELTISRGGDTVATLTSEPVDVVLAPDGSVQVAYRYLLPSGEYLLTSKFQT